jgi:hypothetical protein
MGDEFVPSEAAQREGVCHTESECKALYENIEAPLRVDAARSLHDALVKDGDTMRMLVDAGVQDGNPYFDALPKEPGAALFFGMGIRNFLRDHGFGEKELGVHNLDCVFTYIMRDAVRLEVEGG